MKRIVCMMFIFALVFTLNVAAQEATTEHIGVFVNNNTNSIQLINPTTQEVTDSLLKGELGTYGGGLFDVAITPDGKTAILSNFGDASLIFVDISGGFSGTPTVLGIVPVGFFAEDVAITPDGKYAFVTDGGFSSVIALVDIASRSLISIKTLPEQAQAVSITPDGQTLVTVGYFNNTITSYTLSSEGGLTLNGTEYLAPCHPVNVAISPDGKTVIAVSADRYHVVALALENGILYYNGPVSGLVKGGQSCVFSNDGTKAYIFHNPIIDGAKIQVLDVTGPGQVTPSGTIALSIPRGTSQVFGVETMAIDPTGQYLYVTNPTVSGGVSEIAVIDLATNTEVNQIKGNGVPLGIAFGTMEHPAVIE
ncbi:MAG: YncE family protein [Candidatus Omnitrophota bacterium]